MARTAKRIRFHHSRPAWQLAALLLAALVCLPSIPLAQSPPSMPSVVTVTRSDGALTATWPAVSDATKYHVTYSTDGGTSWHAPVDDHTNVTTTSIEFNADNAKTYIVGVRAGNDDGWSDWRNSPAAGPYTPPNANPPGPVAGVSLTRADGAVTADWPAVSRATHYHVTYTTNNGKSWSLAALSHTTTSLTISKADNAKTYVVGVRTGNAHGWSGWTNSPAIGPYTPPLPAVPTGLTAAGGDQSVTLAWSDPSDASITGYEYALQQAGHDQGEWTGIPHSDAATTSYTATGLTNGTAYTLHLRATNAGGSGAAAQASATPKAPNIIVTAARGDDGDTAGVSWTAYVGDNFGYYRVIVCNSAQYNGSSCNGTVFRSDTIHDANSTGPVTVPGLDAGTGYGVILQVWRNGSALKRHATLPAGPAAPVNLSVTVGDGYLDIAWDAVSDATGYDVRAKKADADDWHDVAGNVAGTSHRYTTTETMDYVAVRASNANGPGIWTELQRAPAHDWLNVVIQGGASAQSAQGQSQLAAPASITVTRDNWPYDEKLHVSWAAVSGAGGYNLACAASTGKAILTSWSWWHCGSVDSGSTTTFTVDEDKRRGTTRDLGYTRSYTVAVRAVTTNPAQASPWLMSADAHPALAPDLNPDKVTISRGAGSVSLSWMPPIHAQGYEIGCATYDSTQTPHNPSYTLCADVDDANVTLFGTINATITSWTDSGTNYSIDNAETYDLRVRTTNAWGNSTWTFAPLIPAMTLTVSNITQDTARLTLSNYPGDWHYKADTGPDNSCKGPVSGSRTGLAGLSNGETYTYSTYTTNRCDTLLVAAAAFTTRSLAVSNVAQTTATVTLNGYAGNWWYQADTGPDATTCQGPISGATAVNLAGLTAGTPYIYRAYDNNTCITPALQGTANELAYASFTTIEITLTASNFTDTGATLTIANHSGGWY